MRNGMLSSVIADLQMIHDRFGDMPVQIAGETSEGSLGSIDFGGITVLEKRGGKSDGQDYAILFASNIREKVTDFVLKIQEGKSHEQDPLH